MKKIILILAAFALTSQISMAADVYSTEKLIDGSTINKCRYADGTVDYCTQKDALKVNVAGKTVLKSRNWLEPWKIQ